MIGFVDKGDDFGMADAVTGFLAILILFSLILMLSAQSDQIVGAQPRHGDRASAEVLVQSPRRSLPPFQRRYVVDGATIVRLRTEAISKHVASIGFVSGIEGVLDLDASGNPAIVYSMKAHASLASAPIMKKAEEDFDAFKLQMRFLGVASAAEPLATSEDVIRATQKIIDESREGRAVPNFYVTASGMAAFSDLFDALSVRGVCFRWRPLDDDRTVSIERSRSQFGLYANRRCKTPGDR